MTYPYAGDGRPYTGMSIRAAVTLAIIFGCAIGLFLALCEYASTPAHAYWSPYQWRTWSYCTKVWAKTYGSNDECRRFFTGR